MVLTGRDTGASIDERAVHKGALTHPGSIEQPYQGAADAEGVLGMQLVPSMTLEPGSRKVGVHGQLIDDQGTEIEGRKVGVNLEGENLLWFTKDV